MMGGEGARIAFFSSMTLLAREIRSVLEARGFPAKDIKLYDASNEGTLTEFAGEALVVTPPDEDSMVDLDIAFLCGTPAQTAPYLDWPSRRGYVAIDLSGASWGRSGVPLVHADINAGDILTGGNGSRAAPLIGVPHGISHNLVTVVAAARAAGVVTDVETVALRPVSDMGERGIDELYRQTVGLLNFTGIPQDVFGRQMAFNVVPSSGVDTSRSEGTETRLREETSRLLGMSEAQIALTSAFVSMFHGHALAIRIDFESPVSEQSLMSAMRSARGLRMMEDPAAFSPVDLAGEESVAVLGPWVDSQRPRRVSMWSFCDNLKGGAALNAVRIAERVADLRGART